MILALIQNCKRKMQGILCICGINIIIAITAYILCQFLYTYSVHIHPHQFLSQAYSFIVKAISSYIDYREIN